MWKLWRGDSVRKEEYILTIENVLGKTIEESERGVIENLNHVPYQLIEEVRQLPEPLDYRYLQYYVSSSEWRYLKLFYDQVVEQGQPPDKWLLGSILLPNFPPEKLLLRDVSSILAVLDPIEGEQWYCFPPDFYSWSLRQFSKGAPAVLRPEVDYHWRSPQYVMSFALSMKNKLVLIEDVVIGTRRWMASIIARYAMDKNLLGNIWQTKALVEQIWPEIEKVSDDARIAIEAMLAEITHLDSDKKNVPGFYGPDAWYAGDLPETT
jgi:hypothetical protein